MGCGSSTMSSGRVDSPKVADDTRSSNRGASSATANNEFDIVFAELQVTRAVVLEAVVNNRRLPPAATPDHSPPPAVEHLAAGPPRPVMSSTSDDNSSTGGLRCLVDGRKRKARKPAPRAQMFELDPGSNNKARQQIEKRSPAGNSPRRSGSQTAAPGLPKQPTAKQARESATEPQPPRSPRPNLVSVMKASLTRSRETPKSPANSSLVGPEQPSATPTIKFWSPMPPPALEAPTQLPPEVPDLGELKRATGSMLSLSSHRSDSLASKSVHSFARGADNGTRSSGQHSSVGSLREPRQVDSVLGVTRLHSKSSFSNMTGTSCSENETSGGRETSKPSAIPRASTSPSPTTMSLEPNNKTDAPLRVDSEPRTSRIKGKLTPITFYLS